METRNSTGDDEPRSAARSRDPLAEDYVPPSECQFCGGKRLERGGPERALRCLDCGAETT